MTIDKLNETEQNIITWRSAVAAAETRLADLEYTPIDTPEDAADMAQQIAVARETLTLARRQLDAATAANLDARRAVVAEHRDTTARVLERAQVALDVTRTVRAQTQEELETRIAETEAAERDLTAEIANLERELAALTAAAAGEEVPAEVCPPEHLPDILGVTGVLPQQTALDAAAAATAAAEHEREIERRNTAITEAWTVLAPLAGDHPKPAANPVFESSDLATDQDAEHLAEHLDRDKFTPNEIDALGVVAKYAGYEIANVVATKIKRDRKAAAEPLRMFPEIVTARPGWDSTRDKI